MKRKGTWKSRKAHDNNPKPLKNEQIPKACEQLTGYRHSDNVPKLSQLKKAEGHGSGWQASN